ncbi:unnamed protein product [Didymodactylos carnosus]|uniref:Integrase zinc-binding domain-containing protein n=1 Tax=Didymodactylos carnosus TaxID=1234261 RepID=A0A815ES41_9BILA|nr:unnamed protein product [Didymodactylos carnosus]CAF4153745.1 unnamed protein product [Didymodactylos carnosus]
MTTITDKQPKEATLAPSRQLRPRNKVENPQLSSNSSLLSSKTTTTIQQSSSDSIAQTNPMFDFDITTLKYEQQKDKTTQDLTEQVKKNPTIASYDVIDDVLYKLISRDGAKHIKLPFIPQSMIPNVMAAYHDHPSSGHFGIKRTLYKLKDRYFWPNIMSTITNYIRSCHQCAKFNIRRRKLPGKLHPITPPDGIFEVIGMDF